MNSRRLIKNASDGRWSADGTQILFTGSGGGIFRAQVDGSHIMPVDESPEATRADW